MRTPLWLLAVVTMVGGLQAGCALFTPDTAARLTETMELGVAITVGGEYEAEGVLKKDGQVLGRFYGRMDCTVEQGQLTGCHQRAMTFSPGGGQ